MANSSYLNHLLQQNEIGIVCVQEHWLPHSLKDELGKIFPSHEWAVKCFDDNDPSPPTHRPRGRGGVACAWHTSMDACITVLPDGTDRLLAIELQTNTDPVLIINTYMPANGTLTGDKYEDCLDQVYEIVNKFGKSHKIIWCGDLNADIKRMSSKNDSQLNSFCAENDLHISPRTPASPTFHHFNGYSQSAIDLFITSESDGWVIGTIHIDGRNCTNTSCHDAVTAHLELEKPTKEGWNERNYTNKDREQTHSRTKWKKLNSAKYYEMTGEIAETVNTYLDKDIPLEAIIMKLNSDLTKAATKCSPKTKVKGKKKRFIWTPILRPLVQESKRCFYVWKTAVKEGGDVESARLNMKNAKRSLRQVQRQTAARERERKHVEIMEANEHNKDLFHQIIRNQRRGASSNVARINFPQDPNDVNPQEDNWAKYFQALATPKNLPCYDEEHRRSAELRHLLLQNQDRSQQDAKISVEEVSSLINRLKNNKACDPFGLQAEHLKFAHPDVVNIVCHILNEILTTCKIPDMLKEGIVTPVHKKQKAKTNPDNYRRITVNSIIGKLLDRILVPKIRHMASPSSSRLQFGFKPRISCSNAAVMLTEIKMEARDLGQDLHIAYMDSSKAFDVVDHRSLLCTTHQQGICGPVWNIIDSAYTNIQSRTKWMGKISKVTCRESQGIRQGAETSADLFNIRSDPLLKRLAVHPDTFCIGTTKIGAIMVADDLALASHSGPGLQVLLNIAEQDAAEKRYDFSESKTKVQSINSPSTPQLLLNGLPIGRSAEETHLGITRSDTTSNKATIAQRIQTGRRTVNALAGAGLHGLNGVSPVTSKKLIEIYIIPRLTYGLETVVLTKKELEPLENYYKELIRMVQHLPRSTASVACYLLMGTLPIEAEIHKKALSLFGNIMERKNSIEYEVIERQLGMKEITSRSWTAYIRRLLQDYHLPGPATLLYNMPRYQVWKKMIKSSIHSVWVNKLRNEANEKSTLKFINIDEWEPGKAHPIWSTASTDPLSIYRATIHAQIAVQRYPLNGCHTSGSKSEICPCCKNGAETLTHFLLHCELLEEQRNKFLPPIKKILLECNLGTNDESTLLQAIMDSSAMTTNQDLVHSITSLSRSLCFKLHEKRAKLLCHESVKPKGLKAGYFKNSINILNNRSAMYCRPGASQK